MNRCIVGFAIALVLVRLSHAQEALTREQVAGLVQRAMLTDESFETEYTVTTLRPRPADETGLWDVEDWLIRDTVKLISTPKVLRMETTREHDPEFKTQVSHTVLVWEGGQCWSHFKGPDEAAQHVRIFSALDNSSEFLDVFRFNLVEGRYPLKGGSVSMADQIRRDTVLSQSFEDGMISHRYSSNMKVRNEVVVRQGVVPTIHSWSLQISKADFIENFEVELGIGVQITVDDWMESDGMRLPKHIWRDARIRENPAERTGRWMAGRTIYERTSLKRFDADLDPTLLVAPRPPNAQISDEIAGISYTIGDTHLNVQQVPLRLDEPILDDPRERLPELVSRAVVQITTGAAPDFDNDEIKNKGGARAGDFIRATLRRHEQSRPQWIREFAADRKWMIGYAHQMTSYVTGRATMAQYLLGAEPTAPELIELLPFRWRNAHLLESVDIARELDLYEKGGSPDPSVIEAGEYYISAKRLLSQDEDVGRQQIVDLYLSAHAKSPYAARLLFVWSLIEPDQQQAQLLRRRVAEEFPHTYDGRSINSEIVRVEGVGKPFELAFKDLVSGKDISIADLKGKIVVINFWATGAGPAGNECPS